MASDSPSVVPVHFDGFEQRRELSAEFAARAVRELALFTPDLEPRVYDHGPFLDAFDRLAKNSPKTRIRVLVRDAQSAVRKGHRLIELARKFTSNVALHRPAPEHVDRGGAYLVVDDSAYVRATSAEGHVGLAAAHDPAGARALLREFDELWAMSETDAELRRIHL